MSPHALGSDTRPAPRHGTTAVVDDPDVLTPVVVVVVEAGLVDVVVVGTDVVGASVVVRGTVIVEEAETEVVGEFPFLTWADATAPKPSVIASSRLLLISRRLPISLRKSRCTTDQ
jgi:hypothetical protein